MHEAFLKRAIQHACENVQSGAGGPYAALIVKAGKVIAEECNTVTSSCDPTAHAEILAIRSACLNLKDFQLNGCVLYANCEPCPMCLGAIYWSRLDAVYFASDRHDAAEAGFDDKFIYQEILLPVEHRNIPMHQIHLKDAKQAFSLWRQKTDKTPY
jgi:guanine deaminase